MRVRVRGLSPIITLVIAVAVAVALGIAFVGWTTGIFSSMTSGQEEIRLYPTSVLYANGTLVLKLANTGSKEAVIYELTTSAGDDVTDFSTGANVTVTGGCTVDSAGQLVVPAGDTCTVTVPLSATYKAGAKYVVTVYTASQYSYSITLTAKP